jgi:hypothetical protein
MKESYLQKATPHLALAAKWGVKLVLYYPRLRGTGTASASSAARPAMVPLAELSPLARGSYFANLSNNVLILPIHITQVYFPRA